MSISLFLSDSTVVLLPLYPYPYLIMVSAARRNEGGDIYIYVQYIPYIMDGWIDGWIDG